MALDDGGVEAAACRGPRPGRGRTPRAPPSRWPAPRARTRRTRASRARTARPGRRRPCTARAAGARTAENSCFSRGVNWLVSTPGRSTSCSVAVDAPCDAPRAGRERRRASARTAAREPHRRLLSARLALGGRGAEPARDEGAAERRTRAGGDPELGGDALLERLVGLDVELAAVDVDRRRALELEVVLEAVVLGQAVLRGGRVHVGLPLREVELEDRARSARGRPARGGPAARRAGAPSPRTCPAGRRPTPRATRPRRARASAARRTCRRGGPCPGARPAPASIIGTAMRQCGHSKSANSTIVTLRVLRPLRRGAGERQHLQPRRDRSAP